MAEKTQHNSADMRKRMERHYSDGLHHKHNKCHLTYRQHYRTHPVDIQKNILNHAFNETDNKELSSGRIRTENIDKLKKRPQRYYH